MTAPRLEIDLRKIHHNARTLVELLADALGCTQDDLTDPTPPTRRDELEIAVEQHQRESRYEELGLPWFKPTSVLPLVPEPMWPWKRRM